MTDPDADAKKMQMPDKVYNIMAEYDPLSPAELGKSLEARVLRSGFYYWLAYDKITKFYLKNKKYAKTLLDLFKSQLEKDETYQKIMTGEEVAPEGEIMAEEEKNMLKNAFVWMQQNKNDAIEEMKIAKSNMYHENGKRWCTSPTGKNANPLTKCKGGRRKSRRKSKRRKSKKKKRRRKRKRTKKKRRKRRR